MTPERSIRTLDGWMFLVVHLLAILALVALFITAISLIASAGPRDTPTGGIGLLIVGVLATFVIAVAANGYFTLQPNEARVLILFGAYKGTVRTSGFHWTNPFNTKRRISLRLRNLKGEKLKVNDKRGNPIEIAAVVVWRVEDTAQATFDVDDYAEYVQDPERVGRAAPGQLLRLRPRRGTRDHAPQRRGRGLRRACSRSCRSG